MAVALRVKGLVAEVENLATIHAPSLLLTRGGLDISYGCHFLQAISCVGMWKRRNPKRPLTPVGLSAQPSWGQTAIAQVRAFPSPVWRTKGAKL